MNTKEIIAQREAPSYLAKSSDPSRRFSEDVYFDGNPLRHRSMIYNSGMQGTFKTDEPSWYRGLK
jgi:hypothetical protein